MNRDVGLYRAMRIARTIVIVFLGELVFRANSFDDALRMAQGMMTRSSIDAIANGTIFTLGLDVQDLWAVAVGVVCVIVLDVCKERGFAPLEAMGSRTALSKMIVLVFVLGLIAVFGAYGNGYVPVNPMYAEF